MALFVSLGFLGSLLEVLVQEPVCLVTFNDIAKFEFILGYVTVLGAKSQITLLGNFEVLGLQAPVRTLSAWQKGAVIIRAGRPVPVNFRQRPIAKARNTRAWAPRKSLH